VPSSAAASQGFGIGAYSSFVRLIASTGCAALIAIACAQPRVLVRRTIPMGTLLYIGSADGVIIPPKAAVPWACAGRANCPAGTAPWQPSVEHIKSFESAFPRFLADERAACRYVPAYPRPLSAFERVYAGVIKDGRRKLTVDFSCFHSVGEPFSGFTLRWSNDSGGCWMAVVFDVDTGTFSDFVCDCGALWGQPRCP
jgi:hypothetical protein